MCELLGLSFNQSVRCSLSFRVFRHRGERNPHGWGVARYEGSACQVLKEPVKATSSTLAGFFRDYEPFFRLGRCVPSRISRLRERMSSLQGDRHPCAARRSSPGSRT